MGIRMDPPREIGAFCFGFPIPVVTPKFMYAYFTDIVTCPGQPEAPNGQTFKLTQNTTFPCRWKNTGTTGPWDVELIIDRFGASSVLLLFRSGKAYFTVGNVGLVSEYKSYTDIPRVCGILLSGHSGIGFIFWLDVADDQVLDLNLPFAGDGLFLEVFRVNDTSKVHRFANTSFVLNKKILFDH